MRKSVCKASYKPGNSFSNVNLYLDIKFNVTMLIRIVAEGKTSPVTHDGLKLL